MHRHNGSDSEEGPLTGYPLEDAISETFRRRVPRRGLCDRLKIDALRALTSLVVVGGFGVVTLAGCETQPKQVMNYGQSHSPSEHECGLATCTAKPEGPPNHGQGQSEDENGCELAAREPYYVTVFDDAGDFTVFLYCMPKETRT